MKKTWDEIITISDVIKQVSKDIKEARAIGTLWCEITDEVIVHHAIISVILFLNQAEKNGDVCLNPPTREEIRKIYYEWRQGSGSHDNLIDAISSRLREGAKE